MGKASCALAALLLVTACGDDDAPLADAGPLDSGADLGVDSGADLGVDAGATRHLAQSVSGRGVVGSDPSGIDCGADTLAPEHAACAADFPTGTLVTLSATAAPGWELGSWSGDCTGTGASVTVRLDADRACTATFHLVTFARAVGFAESDELTAVLPGPDGSYFVLAGETQRLATLSYWIVRLEQDGELAWSQTMPVSGLDVAPHSLARATGGFAAFFRDLGFLTTLRMGFNGAPTTGLIETSTFAYSVGASVGAPRVATTAAGHFLTLGTHYGGPVVAEFDERSRPVGLARGHDYFTGPEPVAVHERPGGGVVVGEAPACAGLCYGFWLMGYDTSAGLVWGWRYDDDELLVSDVIALDDGYLLVGSVSSSGRGRDAMVIRTDIDGTIRWARSYGGTVGDSAKTAIVRAGGGLLIAAETLTFGAGSMDVWLLALDDAGDVEWQRSYGGPDVEHATALASAEAGGYLAVGTTRSWGSATDALLLRIAEDGSVRDCPSGIGVPTDAVVEVRTPTAVAATLSRTTWDVTAATVALSLSDSPVDSADACVP